MQLGLPLKQVGSFIRCSRLKVSVKCCKFLSSRVILKSPNNVIYIYLDILTDFSIYFLKKTSKRENGVTDRRTEGRTDEKTDESDFIGRFPTNVELEALKWILNLRVFRHLKNLH